MALTYTHMFPFQSCGILEIYCDSLLSVELNGIIKPDQPLWRVNDQASVECNPGYQISGKKTLTCLPNGRWSSGSPKCIGKLQLL